MVNALILKNYRFASSAYNFKSQCLSGFPYLETAACKAKDVGKMETITEVEPEHVLIIITIKSNCTDTLSLKG